MTPQTNSAVAMVDDDGPVLTSPWMAAPRTKDDEMEIDPALEEADAAQSTSRFGLLFNPHPRTLRRFAFRQAAEDAAIDRPDQTGQTPGSSQGFGRL